jgi:predicted RNase H-like nuclease (RuvC/YqgF family)
MEMEKMEMDAAEAECLRGESAALAAAVAEKDARLAAAEAQAEQAKARLDAREREMGKLVEKLAAKCLGQESEIARLKAALEERDAEAAGLREGIERLEEEVSVGATLTTTLKKRHAEALDDKNARYRDAESTITEKDAIIAARDEQIRLLRAPTEARWLSRFFGASFFAGRGG